jgi:hypothetical protein
MKFNIKSFALTCGLWWGFGVFFIAWWLMLLEGGNGVEPFIIERLYPGFSISPMGSVIGLIWGFFDGAIGGAIFAWLYNFLSSRFSS